MNENFLDDDLNTVVSNKTNNIDNEKYYQERNDESLRITALDYSLNMYKMYPNGQDYLDEQAVLKTAKVFYKFLKSGK